MQHLTWPEIEAVACGAYRSLFYGPPGTGKSTLAYTVSERLGLPLYNITLTDETPAAELRGHFVPTGERWDFMKGPAARGYVEGALVLLDEIDKASQDCLDFLHGFLNDQRLARITLPTGEIIQAKEGFKVIATMNGDYEDLRPSMQDRFQIAIEVTEPHPAAIAALPDDLQGAAMNIESYDNIQRPSTIRRWAALAALRELPDIGMEVAAKAIFAHRASEFMDAVKMREDDVEEYVEEEVFSDDVEEDDSPPDYCTCADCRQDRARAWLYATFDRHTCEYDDSDETYACPECTEWYSDETDALLCCYDDGGWITDCFLNGRSVTSTS
jgi:MoxR-like ATPase